MQGSGAIVEITAGSSLNDTEVCFDNIVLADPTGAEIEARSECIMFSDELANDEVEILIISQLVKFIQIRSTQVQLLNGQ